MKLYARSLEELVKCYKEKQDPYEKISQNLACTITNIIDAFMVLLRDERRSVDKITVKMLASKAGYSRTTFYEHFCDVFDVLYTLEEMILYHFDLNAEPYARLFANKLPAEDLQDVSSMLHYYGKYVQQLLVRDSGFAQRYKERFISALTSSLSGGAGEDARYTLYGRVCGSAMIEGYLFWLEHQSEIPYSLVRETANRVLESIYYRK